MAPESHFGFQWGFHQAHSGQRAREGDLGIETKPPEFEQQLRWGEVRWEEFFVCLFLTYNGPLDTTPTQPDDKRNIHSKVKDKK